MYKLFITKIPKQFNKKLLYELVLQFSPIKDYYFEPTGRFSIVTFNTKKDLMYTKEMFETIKYFKTEISSEEIKVQVDNLDVTITPDVLKKIMIKFGSVKVAKSILYFKKQESADKAIEECNERFIGCKKIRLKKPDEL